MDILMVGLQEYGADIDGAMERFVGDVDLYKTCFAAFLEDKAFIQLGNALTAADYEKAFESAHTLKGISGNMGLSPLYKVICSMVEKLRHNDYTCLQADYSEVIRQVDSLKKLQQ